MTGLPPAAAFLPARRAPLLHFGFAHACLLVALAALAGYPAELGGFYYHPRLFWLESYAGMAWSGGMALVTPLWLGSRVLAGLCRAPVPLEARLPVALALLNLYLAGGFGVLIGIHKHHPFLPFSQLDAVHAHLHLGAVGFVTLLVVGAGYRMLPITLPAAMPREPVALASVPSLAYGLSRDWSLWTSAGAGALAVAVFVQAASLARGLGRLRLSVS